MPLYTPDTVDGSLLTSGEETLRRDEITSTAVTQATGVLRLSYFTARKTETVTQARVIVAGTAAAATPTLVRYGLYLIDGADGGTLVASTANDTTLLAATNTAYAKAFSVSYAKLAGQRYALGLLVVSGAATPSMFGVGAAINHTAEHAIAPRLSATITGQADLPASFVAGGLTASALRLYGVVAP